MADENVEQIETVTEQAPVPLEDELGAIFDKANAEDTQQQADTGQPRGPDGKFVARETATTETGADTTQVQTDQGGDQEHPVPASWSEPLKAKWPTLDPEVRKFWTERETGWTKADTERAQKLKAYEPIAAVLDHVRPRLQLNGIDETTYVRSLVAADEFLRSKPHDAMRWIAQQYGIDLQAMLSQPAAETEVDPQFAPLLKKISTLESTITQFTTAQETAERNRALSDLEAFGKDPSHPHFQDVRVEMGALLQAGRAKDLQAAYDMAVWANPTTRAKLQAAQSADAEKKRAEEAAKKAADAKRIAQTNLSSKGTAAGQTPVKRTIEEELGDIYDRVTAA